MVPAERNVKAHTWKPRNGDPFDASRTPVFSGDTARLSRSARKCCISAMILTASALLPITPTRKSSAYRQKRRRRKRSEVHTSELLSLIRFSYSVFFLLTYFHLPFFFFLLFFVFFSFFLHFPFLLFLFLLSFLSFSFSLF